MLVSEPESPWALQLAVRVEKAAPPLVAAVCRATVLATIALLDDERSGPGGPWHEAVSTWNGVRIRKIVRRGRASAWERAQGVDGVTIVHEGAEVRAFVPSRMNEAPREITKLQIQATPLDEPERDDELPALDDGAMVVAVTPEVEMTWGKRAAQCAHAGQLLWRDAPAERRSTWDDAGRPVVVIHPTRSLWQRIDAIAEVRVHDAGYTEIPPDTNTTRAWWAD